MIFLTLLEKTLKNLILAYYQLNYFEPFYHWHLLLQFYQDRNFPKKNTFFKKPTEKYTTQLLDLFATYHELL